MGVSRNVVAENTRLQVLAQRFQFGDLSEQFDFLCTVRQLRHAALGRAVLDADAADSAERILALYRQHVENR